MELRLFYAGISLIGFLIGALEVCTMLPESINVREVDTGRDDRILIRSKGQNIERTRRFPRRAH